MCQASNKMENEQTNRTIEILKLLRQSYQILSETLIWLRLDFTQIRYILENPLIFKRTNTLNLLLVLKTFMKQSKREYTKFDFIWMPKQIFTLTFRRNAHFFSILDFLFFSFYCVYWLIRQKITLLHKTLVPSLPFL